MDSRHAAQIVGSDMTVSDKIRALDAEGYPRADIARLLGKRYQHVRNVLEADKLQRPRPGARPDETAYPQLQEAGGPFGKVYRLPVDPEGRVTLPRDVIAVLGGGSGVLIADLEEDRLVILSGRAAAMRAREIIMSGSHSPERILSEELIAERRAEASRE
jgi:hypothetical protein